MCCPMFYAFCGSFTNVLDYAQRQQEYSGLWMLQLLFASAPLQFPKKKFLKFIHFRKRSEHSSDLFVEKGILTVLELHVYELIKFVLISIHILHAESSWNEMFSFEPPKKQGVQNSEKNFPYNIVPQRSITSWWNLVLFLRTFEASVLQNLLP